MPTIGLVAWGQGERGKIKSLGRTDVDLSELEVDLKNIILVLQRASSGPHGYVVDEAKISICATEMEAGKFRLGVFGGIAGVFGAKTSTELADSIKNSQVFEIILRAKKGGERNETEISH